VGLLTRERSRNVKKGEQSDLQRKQTISTGISKKAKMAAVSMQAQANHGTTSRKAANAAIRGRGRSTFYKGSVLCRRYHQHLDRGAREKEEVTEGLNAAPT
jgi:hypothetical protein